MAPKNRPEIAIVVDGSLGELSLFHQTHGFYVHGVSLETAVLPEGWKERLVKVQNENTHQFTGWCVEGHDLAASKLLAFRDKDRNFVRVLLTEGLIEETTLVARIRSLGVSPADRERPATWVVRTCQELG